MASPKAAKSSRTRAAKKPVQRASRANEKKPAARQGRTGEAERAAAAKRKARAAGAAPKLLSGGNPQIPKGDGEAPVRAYIAAMPDWKQDVGRRLDALVTRTVPNVRKAVRWNSPFYGVEGRGWFLEFHCFAKYVKLTFLRGAALRPPPPVASKHPHVRYFHIHEGARLDAKLLAGWIEQAAKLPGEPLF